MIQDFQRHFEGMDPTKSDFHGGTTHGDDIGEQDAFSPDDIELLHGHGDDDAAALKAQADLSDNGIDLEDDYVADAVVESNEQGEDIAKQDAFNTDDIVPLDENGVDASNESSEQAVNSTDDIDLASPRGDAAVASREWDAVESVASSGSVQEPDDEGPGSSGRTMGVDLANDRRVMAMETQGWRYPISHLVFDYRQMTDEEFSGLVEDIKKKGLACPITRWRGEIIDGVHRLLACLEAGVEPVFEDLDDDADPEGHIESKNDKRRHLTFGERAEAAAKRSTRSKRGRPRLPDAEKSANLRNKSTSLTQEEAAKSVKISARSVSHGVRVFSSDSSAIPELQQAVREDTISVSDASRVVHETPEVQRKAVQLVASGESRTAVDGVRQARRESGPPLLERRRRCFSLPMRRTAFASIKLGVYGLTGKE